MSGAQKEKTLIIITGATASGKSALALEIARRLDTEIVSADSRQMFREIPIGTAAPSQEELAAVRHHFIGNLSLSDYYSAALYEKEALEVIGEIFKKSDYAVMAGGSMMYVDAVTNGIDDIPTISEEVRRKAHEIYRAEGLEGLIARLRQLDPEYLSTADKTNYRRLVHALEICMESGGKYSSLRTGRRKERSFRVVKFMIDYPREALFKRINRRAEIMMEQGFEQEARRVYQFRSLNSLNTVGYKELFAYFDGDWDLATAVARLQKNTRVYAKKQLTWLRRDSSVVALDPASETPLAEQLISHIHSDKPTTTNL